MRVEAVCTGCSLLCDDIVVEVEGGRVKKVLHACAIGAKRIESALEAERALKPLAGGRIVSLDEAVKQAAEMLREARRPLLYGWCNSVNEAVRLGLELARKVNGFFDGPMSVCHGYSIWYARMKGIRPPKLDEVLDRADHVVYWGCNPAESHHRHASRFAVFPRGEKTPEGVESRSVTVVDVRPTRTMRIANHRLIIPPGRDAALAKLIAGELSGSRGKPSEAGVAEEEFYSFIESLKRSTYVVVFYGLGLYSAGERSGVEGLYELIKVLESSGVKAAAIPMSGHYNMVGAVEEALSATGYPYAIDFSGGQPSFSQEQTAVKLLSKGEFDVVLVIGSDPLASMPRQAVSGLKKSKVIAVDYQLSLTARAAELVLPAAVGGVESGGTATRMDGERLELKPFLEPAGCSRADEEILKMVAKEL
ncbi:MAG: formylmethanofuran dehydrogenase subunit B [Thermoproteota archaeon]|nr:MAG: formylmethanofuran dehydrogenase subunit B [Candidatus Korarchaeota archaeon]